ncbi:MAG: 1-deoxy-D-xylulose-5-phosphate reductoisomerase [Pseudomonadota bacterium]
MRRVTILGATGSIGQNTLDLVGRTPDAFQVAALTGGRNTALLAKQAKAFGAEVAVTAFPECYQDLKGRLSSTDIRVEAGTEALSAAAMVPADLIMSAIVGAAGLPPGLAALKQGTTLALANKESLVCAGPLLMSEARKHGARILPVDSEHSAIFQALAGEDIAAVERVIVTASGGAFRDWPLERLRSATPAEAAHHPNWDMGQRITIDSASMFNKAMELIEAKEFFGFRPDQIEAVIHPESLVHALVGFADGAMMAHLGPPDMRHAIGFALNWPDRKGLPVERLDLAGIGTLSFEAPDPNRYPALELARQVMEAGGLAGAAFNGAKEAALDAFIGGRAGFLQMSTLVAEALERLAGNEAVTKAQISLENVLIVDHLARQAVAENLNARGPDHPTAGSAPGKRSKGAKAIWTS